jgi:hypothetical protein
MLHRSSAGIDSAGARDQQQLLRFDRQVPRSLKPIDPRGEIPFERLSSSGRRPGEIQCAAIEQRRLQQRAS